MSISIEQLQAMAFETATANGWHDANRTEITPETAYGQLVSMVPVFLALGEAIECIRKPETGQVDGPLQNARASIEFLLREGMAPATRHLNSECGLLLGGSRTQVAAWLVLIISEAIEALEAVIYQNAANFAEEMADIMIRMGDTTRAINQQPQHFLAPIDLAAAIITKNERNKTRGHRHGGKRA